MNSNGGPNEATVKIEPDHDSGVTTITLNRPDRLNALSGAMLSELADVVERVSADDDARVVMITGAGEAFCSGADTDELAGGSGTGPHQLGEGGPEALRRGFRDAQKVILGLHRMEKPVVAAVNGAAVGAGMDLACACDIRLASPKARFMAAYIRVGLFPGYGGAWLYPRLIGMGRAAEMMFTGDFMASEEAERVGLVNRVVPHDELLGETMALARRIADGPPVAMRLSKLMLQRGLEMDLDTAMQMSAAAETITLSSSDHLEGLAAMREKRRPRFRGA